ncbi:response regulator with CheY-like receiver domain and winged-helix DNA-binding domain (plasmid) [Mycolicibacterium chubuense NBB4]|uniref:Response regulator with CheY-like receiver domain and winged-helix DNA-binding domain n=2 Tax=Mycolicibacterium chubuense TaxID=1800 RepID=I4BSW2_MYCCN|nr:response regulator with CheY-like receiver domain and winged-helix DNA-binding domain [Mycolicibacterium chubuense NBB4]
MRDCSTTMTPTPATMLIVGDHLRWLEAVADHFRTDEVSLVVAEDGGEAVGVAHRLRPGFVALDADWLGGSVMQVCRGIRDVCDAHVTMHSSSADENVVVAGLRAGADDVLTGERSSRELAARVRAALRRRTVNEARAETGDIAPQRYTQGRLSIDVRQREVRIDEEPIALTRTQFDILVELAKRRGAVVSRRDLLQAVWGSTSTGNAEQVSVHIGALRRRLGDDPDDPALVLNVRGVGYRLAAPHQPVRTPPCAAAASAVPVPAVAAVQGRG